MGFSRKEYWDGLPCLPAGEIPDRGIEPEFPASSALQVGSLHIELPEIREKIVFLRNLHTVLRSGCINFTNSVEGFLCLHTLSSFYCL